MNLVIPILVAVILVEVAVVGAWNALSPRSFSTGFPTVDLTPPYSEHYARDYGQVMLGIAIVLAFALVRPHAHHLISAGMAYSVFAVPHFFHLTTMEHATVREAIGLTVGDALFAVLGLLVLLLTALRDRGRYRGGRREESRDDTGADRGRRAERLL